MKKTFSLLCVFVIVYPIFAQQKNTEQKYKVYGFQISGENVEKSNAETFPITAKTKKSRENIMQSGIVVSAKLDVPETWKGNNLGVVIYKNLMSCDLYVNDNFIGSVGRKGADFFFLHHIFRAVLL